MKSFTLEIPTTIKFGKGILKKTIGTIFPELGKKVFIITGGSSAKKNGYLDLLCDALGTNVSITIYDSIHSNPKTIEIDDAIKTGISKNIECVIGLGGGSALDAAKAIAAGIGMNATCEDFLYNKVVPDKRTLPIVAIPTTSGTGSELSKGAIVTDEERKLKTGIRGESLYPRYAIVDTELTYSVPYRITMETGFDVLAHAFESYISNNAFAFSEMLSLDVISKVSVYLRKLRNNLDDAEARDVLSYCSMLMGINLGNVGTALPHRLQYPIGALTDTSHGAGLATIYPSWVECAYDYAKDKFDKVLSIISGNEVDSKDKAIEAIVLFLRDIDLEYDYDTLGINENQIEWMISNVTGNIANDPASQDSNIIKKIYECVARRNI